MTRVLIVGGAGFIGSYFTDRLLADPGTAGVTLYDNFSSGREWHYAHHGTDPRLTVVRADAKDLDALTSAASGHDTIIHLASNPDIAAAVSDPDIDFREGTLLSRSVAEAARRAGVGMLLYASGSGVYGEWGTTELAENHGPMVPISTYGASKLAGEALFASYSYMFGLKVRAFRFGNVVGGRQTHGVGFDFIRRLSADPSRLRILGNGSQSKSYVHVSDIVEAVLTARDKETAPYQVYNVATGDYVTVNEIARIACEVLEIDPTSVALEHSAGDRGWAGDVPVVRLATDRIRALGWSNRMGSAEALRAAMVELAARHREQLL